MKKTYILILTALLSGLTASAQADRHDVRAGNRRFRSSEFKEAEIDYRKALTRDSMSVAGAYNLASALYRQEDWDGAGKSLEGIKEAASVSPSASDYYFNLGDVALQKKDYAAAVEAFKQSLLLKPGDIDAKENYIYAKLMLQNQQDGGGGQNDQNQDQNQNDQNQDQNQNNQNQNQDQNQNDQNKNQDDGQNDQNQNNDQNQSQGQQPQEQRISPQQAQQMLQAIQAKEKETQDKVKKEKAELLKSRQKEKNW